ncbi:DUF5340 domain-containing protein [Prochlorothrix hollandica]|uniref:DUF5340 domain-containing protein n=1 Tax=Prochlorothrix hollandica PCC 9006 = CALU 1027 TaxID=317619 RepID=A0A0M2PY09_PROHO|nr:DUF5340 domain-containing protein [Prochlorothrix hollandica]KKJ01065.1 hypothetical protein PROH_01265 [Prochlorothrix hollandica PCC 9006 = CALU 1027]
MSAQQNSSLPVPLPSTIHYEVPLRILEQKTMKAIPIRGSQQQLVHELMVTLRKAVAQQKRLEETFEQAGLPIEHHWSVETIAGEKPSPPQ